MWALIGIVCFLWLALFVTLYVDRSFWSNSWDRLTRARWRDDRVSLQIMLDHLRSYPEEWSISRDSAAFPKEGSKKIYLNYDRKLGWEYTLASFGYKRPLAGYYGKQFEEQLAIVNESRQKEHLLREFFPELSGQLLLK